MTIVAATTTIWASAIAIAGHFFERCPQWLSDAVRILDDLSWDRAHIVGVSMGGMIAQELALRSADRCRSLTLIATHGGGSVGSLPTLRGMRLFLQGLFGGPKKRMHSLPRLLYPDEFLESIGPKAIRSHLDVRLGHPPALRTVLGQLYAVWRHSTESRLSQIVLPTLLVRPRQRYLDSPVPDGPAGPAHCQLPCPAIRRRRARRNLSKGSGAQRGIAGPLCVQRCQVAWARLPLFESYSLVFRTAMRSRRSSFLRTNSALATPDAKTTMTENA